MAGAPQGTPARAWCWLPGPVSGLFAPDLLVLAGKRLVKRVGHGEDTDWKWDGHWWA